LSRTFWISLARAGLLLAAAWVWAESEPPAAGEPLALRWARTCLAHPVRTLIALLLIDRGLIATPRAGRDPLPKNQCPARGGEGPKLG